MTQTEYLTPEQLQCTPQERAGLTELVAQFRSEEAPEKVGFYEFSGLRTLSLDRFPDVLNTRLGFNMRFGAGLPTGQFPVRGRYECGTAACIGGHLSLKMERLDTTGTRFPLAALKRADDYVAGFGGPNQDRPLDRLFYTWGIDSDDWEKITPTMAADAIENMLRTGDPNWPGVFTEAGVEFE